MDVVANTDNEVMCGLEAEAELADRMKVEVSDDLEVKRWNYQKVALPVLVVDHDSPTHLLHAPPTHNTIGTEDSGHWIPPTPYNPRYENCNSVLMPRRRVSSSFFDSSSLPDLSTSLSIAASGGSGSPTMQKNPPEQLIDEEEPVGVDEGKHEDGPEDYDELRSWLECVAISGDVARMRRADRLAPRLSEYGIEGLAGTRKGSLSTGSNQGVWPPAAASSTCAPEVQDVLPDEGTSTRAEQPEESMLPSDKSGFIAESTFAELPPTVPSSSETVTSEAAIGAAPALIIEDPATSTRDRQASPYPPARPSNSPVRRPLIRSSFATSHSNTVVSKKEKPGLVIGLKRKASKGFNKVLEVFGMREKPATVQSRGI